MSRRGRSGPTISLFSFQDIITSVTAIVTVITLLLALDLVQRKQSQSSDSSASLAVELTKRLEQSEAELASLRAVSTSTDDLVREVAATSPAQLRSEIAQRESTIVELNRERARLEQQAKTWQSREKEELERKFDLEPLKQEAAQAEQAATELDRQTADEAAEDRVIFSLPRGMQKEGWLAVIEERQIAVAPLGRPAKPLVFVATGLPLIGLSAVDNFQNWIDREKLVNAYFLLLVRPDGPVTLDQVETKLNGKSVSYGFDLISADHVVLHPEKGAAP